MAVSKLGSVDKECKFENVKEVDHLLAQVQSSLQRSRSALVCPRKRTLEELHLSKQVKSLQPPLPPELALSFYLQGWRLIFAVYHVIQEKSGQQKFNRYQAECAVPWANEALALLTVGMQMAQQLRDKLKVFEQYQDMDIPN